MKKLYLLLAFVLDFGLLLSACGQAEQPAEEVVVEEPAEEVAVEEPAEEVAEEPGDTEGPAPAADGKWCAGTDIVFNRYGEGLIDTKTGVVLRPLDGTREDYPDAVCVGDAWYLPHRRHLRPSALKAELKAAGFAIICQYKEHLGSMVCKPGG